MRWPPFVRLLRTNGSLPCVAFVAIAVVESGTPFVVLHSENAMQILVVSRSTIEDTATSTFSVFSPLKSDLVSND